MRHPVAYFYIPGKKVDADQWRTRYDVCPSIAVVWPDVQAKCLEIFPGSSAASRIAVRWHWWWRAGSLPTCSRVEQTRRPIDDVSVVGHRQLPVVSVDTEGRLTPDELYWNRRLRSRIYCTHTGHTATHHAYTGLNGKSWLVGVRVLQQAIKSGERPDVEQLNDHAVAGAGARSLSELNGSEHNTRSSSHRNWPLIRMRLIRWVQERNLL